MSFVELPNGTLIQRGSVLRMVPLRSGDTRVHYLDGSAEVWPEGFQAVYMAADEPKEEPKRRTRKTQPK